jgi:hypothetical protein
MENQIGIKCVPESQQFQTYHLYNLELNILQTQDDVQLSTGISKIGLLPFSTEFVLLLLSNESSWTESLLELQCDVTE